MLIFKSGPGSVVAAPTSVTRFAPLSVARYNAEVRRGFSSKEILLAIFVLLVAAAVVFAVARSLAGRAQTRGDVDNLRTIYLSVALYESDQNGELPPDLLAIRDLVPGDETFLASRDPYAAVGDGGNEQLKPVDAGLPAWRVESPIRISFTFLNAFATAGKVKTKPWSELKFDPKVGLLASEWEGTVEPTGSFGARVSGKVLRLNTDGALAQSTRSEGALGNVQDVFYSKPR
jgi:hypothetical protein